MIGACEVDLKSRFPTGFPDVPGTEWYAKYVSTAKKKGIIKGYADGTYKPTQEVNRVEFIKMAMSALPFYDTALEDPAVVVSQFSDVYDELWYTPYVSVGMKLNFINKTNELSPIDGMQRQDAVEIIYKIAKYVENNHGLMK